MLNAYFFSALPVINSSIINIVIYRVNIVIHNILISNYINGIIKNVMNFMIYLYIPFFPYNYLF